MNKVKELLKQLEDKVIEVREIKDYNLFVTLTNSIDAGFINKDIGGVYRPISINNSIGGYYYFIYLDNKCSVGTLDTTAWSDFDEFLMSARLASFIDENPTPILGEIKSTIPLLTDEAIKDIVISTPNKLVDLLKESSEQEYAYSYTVENSSSFVYSQKAIATSKGLSLVSDSTSQNVSFSFDSKLGVGRSERSLFSIQDLKKEVDLIVDFVNILNKDVINIPSGKYPILLYPDYGYSFLDTFVLSAISGTAVDAGISRFKKEDFLHQKRIFREDLTLSVNQIEDLKRESISFTREGILGQEFNIIENGELVTPITDLKYSKNLGFSAKSFNSFSDALPNSMYSYESFAKNHEEFIIILSCLGMHTQNQVLGQYSIPSPQALYVKNGEIIGHMNCVIYGDAFEKFLSKDFYYVHHEVLEDPFISFISDVSINN